MNLIDEKIAVSLLQQAGRIDSEAELRAFPEKVRDAYGLKHVCYVATGMAFADRLFVAGTYPATWPEWYEGVEARIHDPIMKSVLEGRPTVWDGVAPVDEFGEIIMDKRREMIGSNGVTLPILSSDDSTALISFVDCDECSQWTKRVAVLMRELKQVGTAIHKQTLHLMGIAPQEIRMSQRHRSIVQLLASGMNENQIAGVLEVSERTVKQHISEAKTRLRCRTKAHLVAVAIAEGFLNLSS